jgi:hypothetical protein
MDLTCLHDRQALAFTEDRRLDRCLLGSKEIFRLDETLNFLTPIHLKMSQMDFTVQASAKNMASFRVTFHITCSQHQPSFTHASTCQATVLGSLRFVGKTCF